MLHKTYNVFRSSEIIFCSYTSDKRPYSCNVDMCKRVLCHCITHVSSMSFNNKAVLELLGSVGPKETVTHLLDAPQNANVNVNPSTLRTYLFNLKKRHADLKSKARHPDKKEALAALLERPFEFPICDASKKPKRFVWNLSDK